MLFVEFRELVEICQVRSSTYTVVLEFSCAIGIMRMEGVSVLNISTYFLRLN